MRPPDDRELDDEIRSHIALEVQERIERGEDPDAARRAAWREFGYVPAVRESIRRVWYSRWFDAATALAQDMRIGARSLGRSKGLVATVVITLALGIGANAAIFSVVRGVLLRPLVNRGEDRLIYLRQSAPALGVQNLAFSVPEIDDFKARATTLEAFGDFSTIEVAWTGDRAPRLLHAGVVSGAYFDVMGLRPVLGRLIGTADDGPAAKPVAVLTHRFWTTSFDADPSVVGRQMRLGTVTATIVGVLEPSVPYPVDTEVIANVVTSPHHLGATMVTDRRHRMTELFARLAPGATVELARAELSSVYSEMVAAHAEAYPSRSAVQLTVTPLRDQITAPARAILLILLAAAGVVFVIACSNVANLILARSVRREGELAVRAALGASAGALRRTLLAESLVLCGSGACLGMLLARPLVSAVAEFAARFSVRALEVTVDATLLWVGVSLSLVAAVLFAFVPRLPSSSAAHGFGLASGSVRITPGVNRRLRVFATTQIAFSFVLLAGAATLIASLLALQHARTNFNTRQVVALDLPGPAPGVAMTTRYEDVARRLRQLPDVRGVALGSVVPWRDVGRLPGPYQFGVEGYSPAAGEESPRARIRYVTPNFFAVLGLPVIAGRDFSAEDRRPTGDPRDPVAIISQSVAQRLFPNGDALNRKFTWTDPSFYLGPSRPRRIIGVVADLDDENVVPGAIVMTVYHPAFEFGGLTQRLFVHTAGDPAAVVADAMRAIRDVAPEQAVDRPATLDEVRAGVLSPERMNAFVVSGFAGVALLIAVVGVSGVLAFSVSARMREFGVRLAMGSTPRRLMSGVLVEGARIAVIGIVTGAIGGLVFKGIAASYFDALSLPGLIALAGAAAVLGAAAIIASFVPAARAARVDINRALRSE